MHVRVIAGIHGGRKIKSPPGRGTHPMSERIRNAIFNALQAEIPGAEVLDAYAGTGVVGVEALSRGAADVTLVEKARVAQKVIAENLASLHVDDERIRLVRSPISSWIAQNRDKQFDIIFVDPPYYEIERHFSTIEKLFGLLKPGGLMVLSKPGKCEELALRDGIVVVDNRSYGEASITYLRRVD